MGILDSLCKEDDEMADITFYQEYWYLPRFTCLYPKLDTTKWRIFSLVQYVLTCTILIYLTIVFAVTAIKLQDKVMEMCQYLNYFILMIVILVPTIIINKHRPKVAAIHRSIGTGISDYDKETEQHRQVLKPRVTKYKKYLLMISCIYYVSLPILLFIVTPILDQYTNTNKHEIYSANDISINLPLPLWSPFGRDTVMTFWIVSGLEIVGSALVLSVTSASTLLYLTISSYVAMELDLLIISLDRLPERTLYMFQLRHGSERRRQVDINRIRGDKDLSQCYTDCLKQNVIHHQRIIHMFQNLSSFVWMMKFTVLATGATFIAISGALIILADEGLGSRVLAAAYCSCEILGIYYICWCAEHIVDASERLPLAIYSTKWMTTNKDDARSILIMMTVANKPLVISCKNLLTINFKTFTNVMNSAYSFFNILIALE